jgi:hypothetical protein
MVTAVIPEGLEPLAAWDAKDRPPGWTDGHTQQMAWWMQACLTEYAQDASRVEFYIVDGPFALVHLFARNSDGFRYHDPDEDGPAKLEPVTVPLAELPPEHLLRTV